MTGTRLGTLALSSLGLAWGLPIDWPSVMPQLLVQQSIHCPASKKDPELGNLITEVIGQIEDIPLSVPNNLKVCHNYAHFAVG